MLFFFQSATTDYLSKEMVGGWLVNCMMENGRAPQISIAAILLLWGSLTLIILAFAYYDCVDPKELWQTLAANFAFMILCLLLFLTWVKTHKEKVCK